MTNPAFILPAREFLHAQENVVNFACPTRSYLRGVHVEPHPDGGALMVATNGVTMFIHYARQGFAQRSAILRPQSPAPIEEEDEWGDPLPHTWEAKTIRIPDGNPDQPRIASVHWRDDDTPHMHILVEEIADEYPDWRNPLGTRTEGDTARFKNGWAPHYNIGLLTRLCAGYHSFRLHQKGPEGSPAILTFIEHPDTIAAIAPSRVSLTGNNGLPDMLRAIGRADLIVPPKK